MLPRARVRKTLSKNLPLTVLWSVCLPSLLFLGHTSWSNQQANSTIEMCAASSTLHEHIMESALGFYPYYTSQQKSKIYRLNGDVQASCG
ncbi:hypothetical protein EJ02DRAFT_202722 [Clathrospora elynae]|uniref:Uncharacterized protein n=1 Tax=Clathrospora elynae TaxID=706981 RepID=A0A6A5SLF9_9PLEO|nr:hypothetical protein EJ02DRAFT_202722 [Clathrospora elynae]